MIRRKDFIEIDIVNLLAMIKDFSEKIENNPNSSILDILISPDREGNWMGTVYFCELKEE
jgi:hypothetical protein